MDKLLHDSLTVHLENFGYEISVEELNAFDSYDYKLRISWKEVGI